MIRCHKRPPHTPFQVASKMSSIPQNIATINAWLNELRPQARIFAQIDKMRISLFQTVEKAMLNFRHNIIAKYKGPYGTASYKAVEAIEREISMLAYETQTAPRHERDNFNMSVKYLENKMKELETCTDAARCARIMENADYYYKDAVKIITDAKTAVDTANTLASQFFTRLTTVENEFRRAVSARISDEFPPLGKR